MPAGRPTKYKEAYCNEVINVLATGLSLTAFAGEIGVARSTVNEWIDNFPEFSEAVRVAKAKRTLALEKGMLSAVNGPAVTARMFALKNADPDEWRERKDINFEQPGGPMRIIVEGGLPSGHASSDPTDPFEETTQSEES